MLGCICVVRFSRVRFRMRVAANLCLTTASATQHTRSLAPTLARLNEIASHDLMIISIKVIALMDDRNFLKLFQPLVDKVHVIISMLRLCLKS